MRDENKYRLDQCDVPAERRSSLESFRAKRREWLSWLDTDEDYATWTTVHTMVWTEVSFGALRDLALDCDGALTNPLLVEALLKGHVARQVLAVRRLMDRRRNNISLPRLLQDIEKNLHLFTRKNFFCFDGLPYNYRAVREAQTRQSLERGTMGGISGIPKSGQSLVPSVLMKPTTGGTDIATSGTNA